MPYVQCLQCGLRSYTAAVVDLDPCPRCGAALKPRDVLSRRYAVGTRGKRRPSLFIRAVPAPEQTDAGP